MRRGADASKLPGDVLPAPRARRFHSGVHQLNVTDQQKADLEAAGAGPTISHRAIHIVLKSWGCEVTVGQIGHWRRTHIGVMLR
mgnify:CR=1 FL=1